MACLQTSSSTHRGHQCPLNPCSLGASANNKSVRYTTVLYHAPLNSTKHPSSPTGLFLLAPPGLALEQHTAAGPRPSCADSTQHCPAMRSGTVLDWTVQYCTVTQA